MYWAQAWKDHMLLKSTLTQVEVECQAAKSQVSALQRKLHALELEVEVRIRFYIYRQRHLYTTVYTGFTWMALRGTVSGVRAPEGLPLAPALTDAVNGLVQ